MKQPSANNTLNKLHNQEISIEDHVQDIIGKIEQEERDNLEKINTNLSLKLEQHAKIIESKFDDLDEETKKYYENIRNDTDQLINDLDKLLERARKE